MLIHRYTLVIKQVIVDGEYIISKGDRIVKTLYYRDQY